MDNEFAELEAELLRLRPRHPSLRLEARLSAALDGPGLATALAPVSAEPGHRPARRGAERPSTYRTATAWSSWKWANWAVAAGLAIVMAGLSAVKPGLRWTSNLAPSEVAVGRTPRLQPYKAGRTVVGSQLDGVVELADGSAVQRVRDYYVDTIEWRDPQGRAQLRWEVPRESVRFVGLAAY